MIPRTRNVYSRQIYEIGSRLLVAEGRAGWGDVGAASDGYGVSLW